MALDRVNQERAERLAAAVREKLLSQAEIVARAQGEMTIRVFRKGDGFDVKVNVSV